jgi:hypothetical protein
MAWTAERDDSAEKALEPLSMLEGVWHGDGTGPYGPMEHETQAAFRGRWLLLTGTIFVPGTDTVTYVSTQVFGYDDDGLLLQYFDTAGAFDFRGEQAGAGLTFTWKRDDSKFAADLPDLWKTSEFAPASDGEITFRYQSMEPTVGDEPLTFEGTWRAGPRPSSPAQ